MSAWHELMSSAHRMQSPSYHVHLYYKALCTCGLCGISLLRNTMDPCALCSKFREAVTFQLCVQPEREHANIDFVSFGVRLSTVTTLCLQTSADPAVAAAAVSAQHRLPSGDPGHVASQGRAADRALEAAAWRSACLAEGRPIAPSAYASSLVLALTQSCTRLLRHATHSLT